jgi:hypothetical protein
VHLNFEVVPLVQELFETRIFGWQLPVHPHRHLATNALRATLS